MVAGIKPRIWILLLLAAQTIYLIYELSFNARLVDSIMVSDVDYFDHLSFIGRCISGIGFTLLLYTLNGLVQFPANRAWWKTVPALLLIAGLAFPAMFFGQEKLINYFVDQSTAEQRMHAQYLILLKKGLANNAVVLKGIEYEKEDLEQPAIKTFISNLGFMVFFTPDYIQSVMQNSDQILEHIARQKANKALDQSYPAYLEARESIEKNMALYNEANSTYVENLNLVSKQAEAIWRDIFAELKTQWGDIQKRSNRDSIEDSLDRLIDGLEQYTLGKKSCQQFRSGRDTCLKKVDDIYHQKMQTSFGRSVEADYWCQRISGKMAYVMQGNDYVQKRQADRLVCNDLSRDFFRQKMLTLKGMEGAYFESWETFVSSKAVADNIRKKLKIDDIHMPKNYRIRSHDSFIHGVSSELTRQLKEAFIKKAKENLGEDVMPMLNQQAFLALALIQKPLKQALNLDKNHAPVSISLSERQFRDQILMPVVTKALEKERLRLLASSGQFEDGAEKEVEGKQYVRSILIPPVAMGLSMFFALLNLIAVMAGVALLAGAGRMIVNTLRVAFIAAVVALPLLISGEIGQTRAFQSIVHETEKEMGPIGSHFIVWLSNLQPVVYPLGHVLADSLNAFPPKVEKNQ
ncbi:MAG: hypothetical protein Q9M28_09930 [Mariprofundaceae bacterium]|nr:hypothetical protein [Mariprofundaceae bacterium]